MGKPNGKYEFVVVCEACGLKHHISSHYIFERDGKIYIVVVCERHPQTYIVEVE